MTSSDLLIRGIMFALLLPAIVLHEVSHGYVAYRLGDTTAKDAGRLTLNPLKHIDLWGTILLPLLMVATLGFGFGYAKPVPINPYRFKDYRKGLFLTGIAGPTTNLLLAIVSGIGVRLLGGALATPQTAAQWIAVGLFLFCNMNLTLMFFNLIPLPPLDGSRVLPLFLSDNAMRTYAKVEQYGFIILLGVLFLAPRYLGFDPIDRYFAATVDPLLRLFTGQG